MILSLTLLSSIVIGLPVQLNAAEKKKPSMEEILQDIQRSEKELEPMRRKRRIEDKKRMKELLRSNPDQHEMLLHVSRFRSKTPGPMLIDEGRVYLAQPDQSLTILDVETGEVLKRIRRFGQKKEPVKLQTKYFENAGDFILGFGDRFDEAFILDKRTGELIESGFREKPLDVGGRWVIKSSDGWDRGLLSIDKFDFGRIMLHWENRWIESFFSVGDKVCVFSDTTERKNVYDDRVYRMEGVLECFSPVTGELLWRIDDNGRFWLGAISDGEKIYVFEGSGASDTQWEECTSILVLGPDGKELESLIPTAEMFGGRMPQYFSRVTFLGQLYNDGRPVREGKTEPSSTYRAEHDDAAIARLDLSRHQRRTTYLRDAAVFGVDFKAEAGDDEKRFSIFYLDEHRAWKVPSNCLEDLAVYCGFNQFPDKPFVLAADERHCGVRLHDRQG